MQILEQFASTTLIVLGLALAIQVPFVLLTLVVALREKHRRAVYVPVDESEALPTNAYMDLTNAMAGEQGFEYLGACRAGNAKLYKVRYDSWIAPDRRVFAVVGAGTMARIPHQATWLTTRFADGRVVITVDHPGAMGADLSGMTEWACVTNADFPELLARHHARVEAETTPVEPYPEDDPIAAHVELIAGRAERMADLGYVRFLEGGDEWKYTAWGALVRVVGSYRRVFVQMTRNYGRRRMSRPGDYGYVPSERGKTRSWLRLVEFGSMIAIVVMSRIWSQRPPATPQQATFRALMLLGAMLAVLSIWVYRWRISRHTVDPKKRRRRRYLAAALACVVVGGGVLMSNHRETRDTVNDCKVLVGGGRVYVVVDSARSVELTSRLEQLRRWAGGRRRFRRLVSWEPSVDVLESDGATVRGTTLPDGSLMGEFMPIGQDLCLIDVGDGDQIMRWRDGASTPVPAEEQEAIREGLADDVEEQCASQKWGYTSLAGARSSRLSKSYALGDRKVRVDLTMDVSEDNSTRSLRAVIEVPGAEPLVRTYPPASKAGP